MKTLGSGKTFLPFTLHHSRPSTPSKAHPLADPPRTMLLSRLLLLPVVVASSVTVYMHSVPHATDSKSAAVPSPIPLAHIEYDASTSTGTVTSYTPPHGSYSPDHLLRVGLHDSASGSWRGVLASASSFAEEYKKKFVVHVDEKGEVYHVGFGAAKGTDDDVEVEVVRKEAGPRPVLNKPVVLNADGKLDQKEPEKTFLQK